MNFYFLFYFISDFDFYAIIFEKGKKLIYKKNNHEL